MFVVTSKCGEKEYEGKGPHGSPRLYGRRRTTVART